METDENSSSKLPLNKYQTCAVIWQQIAQKLNPIFERVITDIYVQTRTELHLPIKYQYQVDDDNKNNGSSHENDNKENNGQFCRVSKEDVMYAPIKTLSRAMFKSTAYLMVPPIACVLDWVRCAFVVDDDIEMIAIFNKICNVFKGKIMRVKNNFHPKNKSNVNFGYRSIMFNVILDYNEFYDKYCAEDKEIVNEKSEISEKYWKQICEIQIILRPYLGVREKMHLYYKIARAKGCQSAAVDFSKFGDLPL